MAALPTHPEQLKAALADRYRIERELGEGGMAAVYVAHDLRHNRAVALKVLKPELAAILGEQRFLREIQVTANLQHAHILPLYDSGAANGALFYVMPLVEGESLCDRLAREKVLPVDDAIRITQQVASALDFAHRRGIIHRDIKPGNILLRDDEAFLTDFGIALALSEAGGGRLTETGLSLGTVGYMSPEQAAGEHDVDARSDIYSLGAVLYEMLAGEPPVTGPSAKAMVAKLMTERPTSLRVVRDAVPRSVDAAVMRALAKLPVDRFSSVREFATALTAPAPHTGRGVTDTTSVRASTRRSRNFAIGALALVGVLGIGAYAISLGGSPGPGAASAVSEVRSIAVLPLDNYSGDSTQDYFAEGMTDELTASLATISRLRVTSRGSAMQFRGKDRPSTPEIARRLNVDALLEGSVMRSGNRVRITAQLIDARADRHLWAQTFERNTDDVLALQAELAAAIAGGINVRLTEGEQSRFSAAKPLNPEGYDAYLRGRYFFNRPSDENLRKAIAEFEESVRLNPTFAAGYSGLSDAYAWAGYTEGFITAAASRPKVRDAAEKAVQLDSGSAEAHTSLAVYKVWYDYDWQGGEREFRRAIALNPRFAFAHSQLALALTMEGRFAEANAEAKLAAELDPVSPQVLADAAIAPMFQKDVPAAKALARRAAELDPSYFFPVMLEGWINLNAGSFRDAIPPLKKSITMGAPAFATAYLAYAYGRSGDRANALATLEELKKMSAGAAVLPFNLALVYLGLGDHQRALDNLEQAFAANSQFMPKLGRDAVYDPLRSEPRFAALLKKMNFVQ